MLSYKLNFNCCANRDGFHKSSHILSCTLLSIEYYLTSCLFAYFMIDLYIFSFKSLTFRLKSFTAHGINERFRFLKSD